MNSKFTVHRYHSLQSAAVLGPLGVLFEFHLKRWMHDLIPELLKRFHSSWILNLTFTSFCLVLVPFSQQKISVSDPVSHLIWVQFEPLRFLGDFRTFVLKVYSWNFTFVKNIYTEVDDKEMKRDIYMRLSHVFGVLMISTSMRGGKAIWNISSVILL